MPKPKNRTAIYHRVSTLDQDQTAARHDLKEAARARGLDIALEVEETGSGARNDRPGLQRIMDAARRGKIDVVIVWKLDRFGRSALDLQANIKHLEDAGVRFVAITQGLDIKPNGDAMSKLILTVLAGVAEFERELIRERVRAGMKEARRRGVQLGRPRVEVDIELARELRSAGVSFRQIAKQLGVSVGKLHSALSAA